MDASQYKDYVLVLLFVKHVSDKYAGQRYAPITIPKGASFANMVALKGTKDIGDDINKKILGPLAAANPQLSQSDFADFNDVNKLGSGKEMVDRLTNLISIFQSPALDFSKNRADGDDLLGDAYEYLMRHFATESGKSSPDVMMQDRLQQGRKRLDEALEAVALLCEPVPPPKDHLTHIKYFCGNVEIPEDLAARSPVRVALYKSMAGLVRAYANIADDLAEAGYTEDRIRKIKQQLDDYLKLRESIRQASGETIDLKAYEADMRHLIDTYIEANQPRAISQFGELGLLEVIEKLGIANAIDSLPPGIKENPQAVAETIANNVRSKIIKEHLNDPAFYDKMSALLSEILADLKAKRISYEEFLRRAATLAKQVQAGKSDDAPLRLASPGQRALYNNLGSNEELALKIDAVVKRVRPDAFRGNQAKENLIKAALFPLLGNDADEVERIFLIIKAQSEY